MRVLIAPNAFKGSLSALEVSETIAQALSPRFETIERPMADGGDGTLAVLQNVLAGFEAIEMEITGPFPETRKKGKYLWNPTEREAFIELALVGGLALLKDEERNPEETTTLGTGQLVSDAISRGASLIRLAIGGSATNDCAIGALSALGYEFSDSAGRPLPPIGKSLSMISKIKKPQINLPPVQVLCDVANPLFGTDGAAIYAPQKGADAAMVARLDRGLRNIAEVIRRDFQIDINIPGAGAAGGFGGGAVFGLNAQLVSGFETISKLLCLEEAIRESDIVVTGEGRIDSQSLSGKVLAGLVSLAHKHGKPVVVVAGSSEIKASPPITRIFQCMKEDMAVEEAIARGHELLRGQAQELFKYLVALDRQGSI